MDEASREEDALLPLPMRAALSAEQHIESLFAGILGFFSGALLLSLLSLGLQLYRDNYLYAPGTYLLSFFFGGLGGAWLALRLHRWQRAADAARRNQDSFRLLLEIAPDGIGLGDERGFWWLNRAGLNLLGLQSNAQLQGQNLSRYLCAEDVVRAQSYLLGALQQMNASQTPLDIRLCHRDGGKLCVAMSATPLRLHDTAKPVLQILLRDTSNHKAAEEKLRQSAAVLESTNEGVMITDAEGVIIDVNPAFTQITGYARAEALGQSPRMLRSERHDDEFYRKMWLSLMERGQWQGEIWNRRKSGEIYLQWQNISTVRDKSRDILYYVALFSDITQIQKSNEQLDYLAHHDPLTGLANRLLLQIRLAHALERAQHQHKRLAVFWIDLDRFKLVNSLLGHDPADKLLQDVAAYLRHYFGVLNKEHTIARTGGDEFAIVLEDVEDTRAMAVIAQRILTDLARPVRANGQEAMLTVSIGVSIYPEDGGDTLLRMAEDAMYRAKQEGGNTYQFCEVDMTVRLLAHLKLENSLWQALERREFVLYYQPQISLANGRLLGAEALIRWQHPEQGLIYPGKFIQLAEESALIGPLSDWALRTACMQNKQWQMEGLPPIRVGVNLSARQIAQENIVEKVMSILHESRLDPQWLKLEVTEGLIIENPELALINLQALKKLGVGLSIDDFGTGYSSFSYLKELPIDELKIDRSFIKDLPGNVNNSKITPAIIAIGHSLHLKVVAEGVETLPQMEFLHHHGCDVIQGFLFSKAVPPDTLAALFKLDFMRHAHAEHLEKNA
jgi:diguanylate cyclase (GGDEF)-like protein/PAS domain S-box-containing protein